MRLEGFYDDKDYYYIVSELVDGASAERESEV